MPSQLAWIDQDSTARERTLRILSPFQEKESRDELWLGSIRDSFADQLFPDWVGWLNHVAGPVFTNSVAGQASAPGCLPDWHPITQVPASILDANQQAALMASFHAHHCNTIKPSGEPPFPRMFSCCMMGLLQ